MTVLVLCWCVYFFPSHAWNVSIWRVLGLHIDLDVLYALVVTTMLMAVFYAGSLLTYVMYQATLTKYDI